jgi:hypothetical protein
MKSTKQSMLLTVPKSSIRLVGPAALSRFSYIQPSRTKDDDQFSELLQMKKVLPESASVVARVRKGDRQEQLTKPVFGVPPINFSQDKEFGEYATKTFKSSMTVGSSNSLFNLEPEDHPGPIKVPVRESRSPWAKIANFVLSTKKESRESIQEYN